MPFIRSTQGSVSIQGRAYPPLSSREIVARLAVGQGQVWLIDPAQKILTQAALDTVKIEPRLGQAERRIILPDGTLFLTVAHETVDNLLGDHAALHGFEQFHFRLVAVALACILGAWAMWKYGLTALVHVAVWLTPDPVVNAMEQGMLSSIDRVMAEPSKLDPTRQAELRDIFSQLLEHSSPTGTAQTYRLAFRDMPGMGPNAFALPNGTIIVTDALAETASPDALAGVIGHEMGHVAGRHGLKQVYRSVGGFVLISMLAGDTGPIIEDALLQGNLILSLSYSRAHELHADTFGATLSREAGYDPDGLLDFFDNHNLYDVDGISGWLSTHPGFDDRKRNLRLLEDLH
ncbi:M48 family metallopeptidase [Ruegeria hyattellae]|uniref:M48 family metallopeptidase n=1 Tax=Ruegeria hyattellae TaxID=3233337 RepID=UPI00355BCECF